MNLLSRPHRSLRIWLALLQLAVMLLAIKIFASILMNYPSYLPPDFGSDFLLGRGEYFWNGYHLAFYTHILTGPLSLLLGFGLVWSGRGLASLPPSLRRWHRRLGKLQIGVVLLAVAPSGAVMAAYADGPVAQSGLLVLALLTGLSAAMGWYAVARRGDIDMHRVWMFRCTLLLSSTLLLRVMGGLADMLQLESTLVYGLTAWASWCIPLFTMWHGGPPPCYGNRW